MHWTSSNGLYLFRFFTSQICWEKQFTRCQQSQTTARKALDSRFKEYFMSFSSTTSQLVRDIHSILYLFAIADPKLKCGQKIKYAFVSKSEYFFLITLYILIMLISINCQIAKLITPSQLTHFYTK